MLSGQSRVRPNTNDVAAKVMDGEAILINITSGMYHSMDNVGGYVWELIEQGHALGDIAEAVSAKFDVDADAALRDVSGLAQQMLEENLVIHAEDGPDGPPAVERVNGRLPYTSPSLNTYRDMSELLALDPPMPGLQEIPWEDTAEGKA